MFSGKGQAKLLLKSDKFLQQRRVISSALPIPSQSPVTSHADNRRIVLSAGMGVCKEPVWHRGPPLVSGGLVARGHSNQVLQEPWLELRTQGTLCEPSCFYEDGSSAVGVLRDSGR